MMTINEGLVLQIAVYLLSMGMTAGAILWRIKELEKRVEKHNNLIERMTVVEQSVKASWHQIDDIKEALRR